MKIGLVAVDSKISNLALMKLSAYHKKLGDEVKIFEPLIDKPDLIYASKVFDSTPDYEYYPADVPIIKGGTGYDIKEKLSDEIESMFPDYSIFNHNIRKRSGQIIGNYALGFTSRGCSRQCPFCLVPEKEGDIKAVADIYDFWNGQSHLMLLDNNLTALPERFELTINQLIKEKIKTDFSQGLDIRFITAEMAQSLAKVKLWKQIHFAWDNIQDEEAVRRGIEVLNKNGVKNWKLSFYVLIGFNTTPEEDLYRVEVLRGLGVDPFVMPYNRNELYQRRFARYVNHKAIFKSTTWELYTG